VRRLALLLLVLAACPKHSEQKPVEPRVKHDAAPVIAADAAGSSAATLPPAPPLPEVPPGLPQPPPHDGVTPDAVAFGALLFADTSLSHTGKTACATCHDPAHGFSGRVDTADGGTKEPLRTPALVNLAWVRGFGWDGKTSPLENFIAAHAGHELGLDFAPGGPLYAAYAAKLGGEHSWITALTAYVLTRYAGDSTWDRLERAPSRPKDLDDGYKLFVGKAGCAHCHAPPLYTDATVHDGYRTPSMRGVAARPALLHDGSAPDIAAAIDHHGPVIRLSPAEKSALVAFVQAL